MSDNKLADTTADLKKKLAYIESSSRGINRRFEMLQRQTELLKIEFLEYSLEKHRTAVACQRGFAFLIRDRKKIGTGLAVTVGAFILVGLIAKDKDVALNAGLAGFNGVLQGFGETRWAVLLERELMIEPCDDISMKGTWVTFESLITAIDDLKTEALQGKRLGSLDNIIQRLQHSRGKLIYIALPNRD